MASSSLLLEAAILNALPLQNNEYDPFARLYNRHWGADYRAEAFPVVERLLLSRLKPHATVLDVCCGTGQFTELVRSRGYELAGIDSSPEMIRYARENAPLAELTVADVRRFSLGRKFDAAYSVFESLNHVPELKSAFKNVKKHLEPEGRFLFDLNREEAFVLYWNTTDSIVTEDMVCVLRMEYDEKSRIGTCDVTEFAKKGEWTRTDYTLRQTCHDPDDVQNALFDAGFSDVSLYDARDVGMKGDAGYGRMFFLAQS
ncbi:MAG: class I SAM-dependent methyltransferase [Acidobacteriota bacterium]|nr:class I SAM-dependent methyltransferase [Acidobacteriota bacterium]